MDQAPKNKTRMLILDRDDPKKELEFEIEFMLSLSATQRYKMMNRLVRQGLKLMRKNEYKRTPSVVARPQDADGDPKTTQQKVKRTER